MLVISTQNWSILAKFAKKNPAKSAVFYWLFLGEVSPRNFPWNRPIFLRICPWKSFEIWLFSAKIPRNRPIFLRILTFLPRNRPIFPRICPWKSREILLFFLRNIRSPGKSLFICQNDLPSHGLAGQFWLLESTRSFQGWQLHCIVMFKIAPITKVVLWNCKT